MDWLVYLVLAITVIFTIILWNVNNSIHYRRLKKIKAAWDSSDQDFKDKVKARAKDIRRARTDIGSLWDQIGDLFDDEDYGGYGGADGKVIPG